MKSADTYSILRFNGRLSHIKSLKIAADSDLLILHGSYGKGAENGLTGKIFEYMMLQRPVMCFTMPESMMAKTIQSCRIGRSFDKTQNREASDFFLELYNNWKKDRFSFDPNEDEIRKYNRKSLTEELALVLDRLESED